MLRSYLRAPKEKLRADRGGQEKPPPRRLRPQGWPRGQGPVIADQIRTFERPTKIRHVARSGVAAQVRTCVARPGITAQAWTCVARPNIAAQGWCVARPGLRRKWANPEVRWEAMSRGGRRDAPTGLPNRAL